MLLLDTIQGEEDVLCWSEETKDFEKDDDCKNEQSFGSSLSTQFHMIVSCFRSSCYLRKELDVSQDSKHDLSMGVLAYFKIMLVQQSSSSFTKTSSTSTLRIDGTRLLIH